MMRREHGAARLWPRDVAHRDRDALAGPDEVAQRRARDGPRRSRPGAPPSVRRPRAGGAGATTVGVGRDVDRRGLPTRRRGATDRVPRPVIGRRRPGRRFSSVPMPSIVDRRPRRRRARNTRRLAEGADAAGRPGRDDVARLEGEEPRAEGDQLRDAVDQVGRRGVLATSPLTVHRIASARVRDLVRGHDPRAHRAERVEALAAHPLPVAALQVARRDVVEAGVPEDVVERVRARRRRAPAAR